MDNAYIDAVKLMLQKFQNQRPDAFAEQILRTQEILES
jgi:hypothetical protein